MIPTLYPVFITVVKKTYRYVSNVACKRRDNCIEDFTRKHEKKDALRSLSLSRGYNIKREVTRDMLLGCKSINLVQNIGNPDEHGDQLVGFHRNHKIYIPTKRL